MTPSDEAQRLRIFISRITDYAIYMLGTDGTVASWNAGAERFKGYAANEIIGQHFSNFYTTEDRASGLPDKALAIARDTGKFEGEGWRVRKDGTRFWASVVIDPIRDESGQLLGFAKITRDITDKRAAQEALKESEERFRLLVQGVTDYAIYMLSPAGDITNWNAGARRIKQYEEHEVLGSHFSRFYTDEDRARGLPAHALAESAAHGRFEAEGWRVRKDGTRFWAHVVIDPIRNEAGDLVGFAKITRDITERQQAAQALDKAREVLFQSQKLEAIGKLTGGVAHDFNNLLSVITNGLDMLRAAVTKDPGSTSLIDSMEKAALRGASLTNQLLTFARQQPVTPEPRELNRVISAFESVLRRATRSSVRFEVETPGELPAVMIDVALFETALLNLIVNANDATLDGGSIRVATHVSAVDAGEIGELAAGRYVVVSVQDTGSGMSEDVILRAVEPFFTTKPVGKGTGLGLSQVYGMVRQFGGELKITSQVAQGTVISLYFPATSEQPVDEPLAPAADKVLVVDDQPDVLEMAAEMFRTLGFHVITASSGRQALEILARTHDIYLLFTDVVMPGLNGVELGHKAKALSPKTRVILSSGYTTPAGSLKGIEFLPKPYRIADILKKLRVLA